MTRRRWLLEEVRISEIAANSGIRLRTTRALTYISLGVSSPDWKYERLLQW